MQSQNQNLQYITRIFEADIGHRVMNEKVKCFSIHGHRVKIEVTFSFSQQQAIGYCIDFKEIKRIAGQWIDDYMDHGFIANPEDKSVIQACKETNSKYYLMSLNGENNYCNPTAENIARELFLAITILFSKFNDLQLSQVRYYETPNCFVDCFKSSLNETETKNFYNYRGDEIEKYADKKGIIEYDDRK